MENNCKINDFKNIEKKLTLTEGDLVMRHILEVGRLFLMMVTGVKEGELGELLKEVGEKGMDEVARRLKIKLSGEGRNFVERVFVGDK